MSGTRRFWFGNVSADSTQFGVMSDLIRSWIGLESVSGRPTYARYITDLRLTNHLPSVAELRPTRPRTLPDKTPTYNRQTTDNLSGRDLSNMFERSLPDKFVCPNINRHQTDKTESIPTVNRSLPEFQDFCQFEVGFVSVWPVWLGYEAGNFGGGLGTFRWFFLNFMFMIWDSRYVDLQFFDWVSNTDKNLNKNLYSNKLYFEIFTLTVLTNQIEASMCLEILNR